jgi:uncharacterized protein
MRYRRFGKTHLDISVFSLGTMRCLASATIARQTIERAIELGINHLETAQGYGESERFVGQALQTLAVPRSQIYLTTKIPPTPDADAMERSIDESLGRLQVDYLDTLAIHGINTWEHLAWVETGGLLAVQRAIADGRVRHVGFSTHGGLDLIEAAIATDCFEFVNLHYSLFFQRHAPAVELAHQKDMGIFIISPADKAGLLYTPPATLSTLCDPWSPLEVNYRWLLSDPRITTLSVGPANPQELAAPLRMGDRVEALTQAELDVLQHLQDHQKTVLGTEQCSQCYACLPCPAGIHIPEVLRLRNLAIAYDMTQFGEYRYRMFEQAGHWFPGTKANRCTDCGDCLPRCPEQLAIPTLLRDTHERLKGPAGRRLWQE